MTPSGRHEAQMTSSAHNQLIELKTCGRARSSSTFLASWSLDLDENHADTHAPLTYGVKFFKFTIFPQLVNLDSASLMDVLFAFPRFLPIRPSLPTRSLLYLKHHRRCLSCCCHSSRLHEKSKLMREIPHSVHTADLRYTEYHPPQFTSDPKRTYTSSTGSAPLRPKARRGARGESTAVSAVKTHSTG